jgi:hypothetical protein
MLINITGHKSRNVLQRYPVVLQEITKTINDMNQSDELREYVLDSLATFVVGYRLQDCFAIWTSTCVNAKTLTKVLAKVAFGGYF